MNLASPCSPFEAMTGGPEEPRELLRHIVQGLPLAAALISLNGFVHSTNLSLGPGGAWRSDFEDGVVGAPYQTLVDRMPLSQTAKRRLDDQIEQIVAGSAVVLQRSYKLLTAEPFEIVVRATRLALIEPYVLVVFLATRTSEKAQHARRRQQVVILRAEEEERRRIARELHDDTFQQLALIQVSVATMRQARTFQDIDLACDRIENALMATQHQIRTLSFLLHPPGIGSGGIVEALYNFCKGLSRRNSIDVEFEGSLGNLKCDPDLEIALYRVAQEALINACKHAKASEVRVRLFEIGKDLVLEVADNGMGITLVGADGDQLEAIGVGLLGMQERVEALGGEFAVLNRNGTVVRACFPRRRKSDYGP